MSPMEIVMQVQKEEQTERREQVQLKDCIIFGVGQLLAATRADSDLRSLVHPFRCPLRAPGASC